MATRAIKQRTARCMGRNVAALLFALFATTPSMTQAAVESVAPVKLWCDGEAGGCTYPTDIEAAKAVELTYNSRYAATNPYHAYLVIVSCNGGGLCLYHFVNDLWTTVDGPLYLRRVLGCPIPMINPAIPYTYKYASGMCEREAQCPAPNTINPATGQCVPPEILTITLEGGTTTEPGTSLPFIATIKNQDNQPPKTPVTVKISLKVDSTSGGHDHGDNTRPRGGIANVGTCPSDATCWSEPSPANNGVVVFNFNAPEAAGTHTITATCEGCSNAATKAVDVKVNGIEPIPNFPYYALVETNGDVIGATDLHSNNHNLLPAAAGVLMRIAVNYHFHPKLRVLDWKTNTMVLPPPLHINDASLVWGGKFDIKGKWTGSHAEHMRGTSVDLRANENVGAIPPELFEEFDKRLMKIIPGDVTAEKFLRECSPNEKPSESNPNPVQHNRRPENYCVSQVDGSFDANRHYHVRLLGE